MDTSSYKTRIGKKIFISLALQDVIPIKSKPGTEAFASIPGLIFNAFCRSGKKKSSDGCPAFLRSLAVVDQISLSGIPQYQEWKGLAMASEM